MLGTVLQLFVNVLSFHKKGEHFCYSKTLEAFIHTKYKKYSKNSPSVQNIHEIYAKYMMIFTCI